MSLKAKIVFGCLLFVVAAAALLPSSGGSLANASRASATASGVRTTGSDAVPRARVKQQLDVQALTAHLPLSFEKNTGQFDTRAHFASRGLGYNLFLTTTGAVLELHSTSSKTRARSQSESSQNQPRRSAATSRSVVSLKLQGANAKALATGVDELRERRNYFIGNDANKWRTNVPTYRAVRYDEIYPGISLTYYGNQQQLEYDFVIAAGADPGLVRLSFNAGVQPQISEAGDLLLRSAGGEVRQQRPIVYQEIAGRRQLIDGSYVLLGKRQVGFEVGSYDRSRTLVIDPTLVYSTYLGGGGDDLGSSIAVDNNNNVYIAGTTSSTNFPLQNPAFAANAGLGDIFVTKIDAAGANIIYSTYVGGSGLDRGDGIAIDSSGNAYVVGRIDSTSINFPSTPGSFASSYRGGDFDGVVFKLNTQGNSLVYSGFLGGEENDSVEGVTVDAAGIAYVTGGTKSNAFPTTGNAYQGNRGGDTDAFLTKINATGSGLLYSTYIGGSGTDRGSDVAIDGNGNAYLAGFAGSADFPTENAFQNNFGGSFDAFVAHIDTKLSGFSSLVLCSYLGGQGDDKAYDIALDNGANNLLVVGQTSSSNFPVLNPVQPASGGGFDAFVARISVSGSKVYATYLGGSGDDRGTGIAVNTTGAVYVTGFTSSTNFPTVTPLQSSKAGGSDAFVTKLNTGGSALLYSTYLGGSANESSTSTVTSTNPIALDSSSNAYVTGYTASNNFPTAASLQGTNAGGASDAFVAKISDSAQPLDDAQFFVNQHYLDFLDRQPDSGGLAYWTSQIMQCGSDVSCVNAQRINVSAAFFIEAEFQQTGSFVYRLFKGALGRQPFYPEFVTDRAKVVGGPDLTANKTALLNEFVQRAEFKQLYPDSLSNIQFVNTLFDTAGLTPFVAERQQQIDAMNAGKTRAQVVGDVIEIQAFKDHEYNPSFVLMQYFGYLRRDADPVGYGFWLDVLNNRDPNNYHAMVCAYITSAEYQQRFSPVVTHNNSECAGVH